LIPALEEVGAQHILVVVNIDAAIQACDDQTKSIGIHLSRSENDRQIIPWTLYLEDVTKR